MVMATNSDYWKKREQENRNRNIRSEAEYAKEIRKTYEFAMDQIQREIDSFYAKYAEKKVSRSPRQRSVHPSLIWRNTPGRLRST